MSTTPRRLMTRSAHLLLVAVVGLHGIAAGQGMSNIGKSIQRAHILLLVPDGHSFADSAIAVRLTRELHDRLRRSRNRVQLVDRESVETALIDAGIRPTASLPEIQAAQLAAQLGADAYTVGRLATGSDTVKVHLRVVDLGMSGVARDIAVALPGSSNDRAAMDAVTKAMADSLERAMRSGDRVRECFEQIGEGRYGRAADRARDAAKEDPGNSAAYLCLAQTSEFQQRPVDVRWALEQAVTIAPWHRLGWDRLLSHCLGSGDRPCEARARHQIFLENPADGHAMDDAIGAYLAAELRDSVMPILDHALAHGGDSLRILSIKEGFCSEALDWRCALDILPTLGRLDPQRIDEDFFAKLIGAAQTLDDVRAQIEWGTRATQRFPTRTDFWRALGAAHRQANNLDSAVFAFDQVYQYEPGDPFAALSAARARVEADRYDAETWRMLIDAAKGEEADRQRAAAMMVQFGRRTFQQQEWGLTISILERSLSFGPPEPAIPPASFFLSVAYFQELDRGYREAQITETFSCEIEATLRQQLERGREHLERGRQVRPDFAAQIAQGFARYAELLPQVREILGC